MDAYSVASIRDAERRAFADIDPDVLMQRAAAGLATAILRRIDRPYGARVLLVVGPGNNGGDALFAGVRLARRGVQVSCWATTGVAHDAGRQAFLAAGGRWIDAATARQILPELTVVVDGVAGIGSRPGLAVPVAAFAAACTAAAVPVVSVDLPSGLAPDLPFSDAEHFRADLTVTFGGYKLCLVVEPSASECGEVELVDIGLDLGRPMMRLWEPSDVAAHWPWPEPNTDKYGRGVVGLDTGSQDYPGAAVLGAAGAIYAGAGMVRYLGPSTIAQRVLDRFPNVVAAHGRAQAVVLGSGWGERQDSGLVERTVAAGSPAVIDADALRQLPNQGHPQVLLTPHAGELAYLLGQERDQVCANPLAAVREATERTGCTVLLKGATQYLAVPGREWVDVAVPGPAWTAQAGSGDVLAGIAGALLSAGVDAATAGICAASIQALAAVTNPGPLPPQELAAQIPHVLAELADQ